MIAILTKYLPPTNYRCSRVVAYTANGHRLTHFWEHEHDVEKNHELAALALMNKLDWDYSIVSGSTKEGYAFIMLKE